MLQFPSRLYLTAISFSQQRLKGGTTAVVALVREKRLVVAWLGDSQALLVRRRNPVRMVEPHKPELPVSASEGAEDGRLLVGVGVWVCGVDCPLCGCGKRERGKDRGTFREAGREGGRGEDLIKAKKRKTSEREERTEIVTWKRR